MAIGDDFKTFCSAIWIKKDVVDKIKTRYHQITKRINQDFWYSNSDINHSFYTGSYGRGTDISTSDIDMIVELPGDLYYQYDKYQENGQSALLQRVKQSLQNTYSTSHLKGDGQVVEIVFNDGITFEILPAFINKGGYYTYPDSNNGGSWKTANPKAEIAAMKQMNNDTNKNLKRLCRMTRAWKQQVNVDINGFLIDTLAYNFIQNWEYKNKSYLYYDFMSRDFFKYLKEQNPDQVYWLAPGSSSRAYKTGNFQYKASKAYDLTLEAINKEKEYPYSAKKAWREIYGTRYPQ